MGRKKDRKTVCVLSENNENILGAIHSTKISDRSEREKWSTSKGGPKGGRKCSGNFVEWIAPSVPVAVKKAVIFSVD